MRHKKKLFEFFDISPREPSRKTSQQEKKLTWMKKKLKNPISAIFSSTQKLAEYEKKLRILIL